MLTCEVRRGPRTRRRRTRGARPASVRWCGEASAIGPLDVELALAEVGHRSGAVEQRDPQGGHRQAVLDLLDDVALQPGDAGDLDDVAVGEGLLLPVGGDRA